MYQLKAYYYGELIAEMIFRGKNALANCYEIWDTLRNVWPGAEIMLEMNDKLISAQELEKQVNAQEEG